MNKSLFVFIMLAIWGVACAAPIRSMLGAGGTSIIPDETSWDTPFINEGIASCVVAQNGGLVDLCQAFGEITLTSGQVEQVGNGLMAVDGDAVFTCSRAEWLGDYSRQQLYYDDSKLPLTAEYCGDFSGRPKESGVNRDKVMLFICYNYTDIAPHLKMQVWDLASEIRIAFRFGFGGKEVGIYQGLFKTYPNDGMFTWSSLCDGYDCTQVGVKYKSSGDLIYSGSSILTTGWDVSRLRPRGDLNYFVNGQKYCRFTIPKGCIFYAFRVYKKVLTEEELEFNQMVDRERFYVE